jgi:tetratricopeptide (TPR) repeat protein
MASIPTRLFFGVALLAGASAAAEEEWRWPEPKNLQVLPKDFTGERLSPVMRGFSQSLGVRCTYCHVGEEGKPLSTVDFVSDKNPNKERAREMLRMLNSIEGHLKKITPSGDQRVNLWCFTCHQGRPRPMTLEEDLGEKYRKAGVKAALSRYGEIKERYYGRGGYDFSEGSLASLASELAEKGDRDAALAFLRLNASEHPQSSRVWAALGGAYGDRGQAELARVAYDKALELDPDNATALEKLRSLEAPRRP